MNSAESGKKLTYTDRDGIPCEIEGCSVFVDEFDRYWIWSDQLEQNLAYKTTGRDNALLAAIDALLFTVQLRDKRIAALQRIADLAIKFADEVKPDEPNEEY